MTALLGDMLQVGQRIDLNERLAAQRLTNPGIIFDAQAGEYHLVLKKNQYDRRRVWATEDRQWNSILAIDGKLRVKHVHARLTRDFALIEAKPLAMPQLRLGATAFDGGDDVRLIAWNGKSCLLGSCYKLASSMRGGGWQVDRMTMRMFLAPLDQADAARPCVFPAFFNNTDMDKNWITHERSSGELALSIDFNRNIWIGFSDFPAEPVAMPRHALEWRGGWSGSSSLVEVEEGYVAILHRAVTLNPSLYIHMFVVCDRRFKVLRRSAPFSFEGEPVEFCMGMTRDPSTRQLAIAYGVWDEEARLVTVAEPDILTLCTHKLGNPAELYQVT